MWPMDSMVMLAFRQALYRTSSPSADTRTGSIDCAVRSTHASAELLKTLRRTISVCACI